MALDELFAGLSRAAESTRRRIQDLLGRSRNPLWLVLSERQTHRKKGVAAAKSRDSADIKDDVVVKR
jgi:hypothetical protein